MTSLHLFPSYSEGGRSEVNGVTQSPRRRNSLHAHRRERGFYLTNDCEMFNRGHEERTVK